MKMLHRLISTLLACGLSTVSVLAQTPPSRPLADGHIKFFGGIYSELQKANLENYFNQVTPENASKWGSVEGTRDVMNWTEVDAAHALAKQNGYVFRFHVLLWGSQQPAWMESLPAAEQLAEIEEWMQAVAARYPDLDYIEVVNEPTNQPPNGAGRGNYMNALGGSGTTGWDWILTAFRMARRIFPPTTKLMINEYGVTNDSARLTKYIGIVNLLKGENLIDAVGVQAHYFSTRSYGGTTPSVLAAVSAQTKNSLDLLAATNLPLMVMEMDVDSAAVENGPEDEQYQLSEYQRIFPIFWQHPAVIGVTLWGYRPGMWRSTAYLVRADGTERPAMTWLREYLTTGAPSITAHPVAAQAVGAGGSVTLNASATGTPTPTLQWQQNGRAVAGATSAALSLANVQPANTGFYTAVALGGTAGTAAAASTPAIVGVTTSNRVIGSGEQRDEHVKHPNGNFYDQVLATGGALAVTADHAISEITRTSFIDVNGDIVQIEFAGPGTLSVVLDAAAGPAAPEKYSQSGVPYMRGLAGIVIAGSNEFTNVSVFTVGRATAWDRTGAYDILKDPNTTDNNPANNGSPLFVGHANTTYDGVADIAFIAITSSNGKFGGVRTSNTRYLAERGFTGLYAPGVQFTGPVFLGDVSASGTAKPVILIGSALDRTWITGGSMEQLNGQSVQVSGLTRLEFKAGQDSHGRALTAQTNQAVFKQNGSDVTAQIVVNP
jgi:GH35 family endo-1,4-beta-xylanase